MSPTPAPPSVTGYEILGPLASGAFGSVWRARRSDGIEVALKVVEPHRAVEAAAADRIFRREALATLNLDHPGIARALDAGRATDGRPYIAFELLSGPTLRDAVKERGPLPAEEVVRIGRDAAAALDHAHRHGLVHGDVTPNNVMLAEGGTRLLDFGLARELAAIADETTWGTPGFLAPEVAAGEAPTAASDLFSLGMTLAFALLGRKAPGPGGDGVADLDLPADGAGAGIPPGLRSVIERLGRSDPAKRYGSAAELRLDLDALRAGETPLGAALAGAKARVAAGERRSGAVVGVGIGLALAAVAAAVYFGGRGGAAETPPATTPAPAPAPAPASDPLAGKVEALRVLLGREPVDFGAARALGEEIRKAGGGDQVLADLHAAWRAAAAELAARKEKEARAAFDAGGPEAWNKVLMDWPKEFADAPEAVAMAKKVEEMEASSRKVAAMVDRHVDDMEKELASLAPSDPAAPSALARIDHDLKMFQDDPIVPGPQRIRSGEVRAKAVELAAAAAKAAKEKAIREAVRAFLEAAAKPEPRSQVDACLREAAAKAEGTEFRADLEDLRLASARADAELGRVLGRLVGKPWAAVIGGELFVGAVESPLDPEAVFLPRGGRCPELLTYVPNPATASAWLLLRGLPNLAKHRAPPDCSAAKVLSLAAYPYPERRLPEELVCLPKPPGIERQKENPAKQRAVDAYLGDDLLGAWKGIEEAFRTDYRDAEVHVLAAKVLMALSRPLPTRRVANLALAEALRACEFDPSLPSAPAAVVEIALPLDEEESRSFAQENRGLGYLNLVLRAMEASLRLGKETPEGFVTLAGRLHRAGDDVGAKATLEFARRAHATLPRWAEDLLK